VGQSRPTVLVRSVSHFTLGLGRIPNPPSLRLRASSGLWSSRVVLGNLDPDSEVFGYRAGYVHTRVVGLVC
jgi:hypothetical protein